MKMIAERRGNRSGSSEFLRRQGCDAYLDSTFFKPLPPDDMEHLLVAGLGAVLARPSAAGK